MYLLKKVIELSLRGACDEAIQKVKIGLLRRAKAPPRNDGKVSLCNLKVFLKFFCHGANSF